MLYLDKPVFVLTLVIFVCTSTTFGQTESNTAAKIASAKSSAPSSIADIATIMDWPSEPGGEMTVLREGSDEWTCLPDMPSTPGDDPMCLDNAWMKWADAWMNKKDVNITTMGFGYMLQGGTPESNTDPYAESPTPDNEWIEDSVPHLMILVPDEEMLEGLPTDHTNGGPWVMWGNTPYVHIMAPMPKYNPR